MCGITGIYAFNMVGRLHTINLAKATQALSSRGPDYQNTYMHENVGLGHRRLPVIDISAEGNQPMLDASGRYALVYNGEIYNFRELRSELEAKGVVFHSESDTEVLLHLLIRDGTKCLEQLNGFFSFAFYDSETQWLLLARDRFGIKPLVYYQDLDKLIFSSEFKSIYEYGIDKEIDRGSLLLYFQLNYIPAPYCILKNAHKLEPGHFLSIRNNEIEKQCYYDLEHDSGIEGGNSPSSDYSSQKERLRDLLEQSVVDRLYADVPLGAFLSGGIDSSIISALASRHTDKLHTFSIGYRDEPYFDETKYARKVAKHLGTEHTVFSLSNKDLFEELFTILDYLDEPFADSSAIAVNILSRETRQYATVALSGDGADELFGGYNKHRALLRMMNPGTLDKVAGGLGWLWNLSPQSRNNSFSNKIRQLTRFSNAMELPPEDRYWFLASFQSMNRAMGMLADQSLDETDQSRLEELSTKYTGHLRVRPESLGQYLLADLKLVLPNDMLAKVDMMSMAQSLEVRVPFLDHKLVEFVTSLPDDAKVNKSMGKRILQDTFIDLLPSSIYRRPKKGFEVPLLKWFRKELKSLIWNDLLSREFIQDQGIFNYDTIRRLKRKLQSSSPGDSHATIWAMIVFQWWYRKYFL